MSIESNPEDPESAPKAEVNAAPPVEPDHYWDNGHIPVFKPSMEEFRDFRSFMERVDEFGSKSGIVKIIPPKEWHLQLPKLSEEKLNQMRIRTAILQHFNGHGGKYRQMNVIRAKKMSIRDWKELCDTDEHRPPKFSEETDKENPGGSRAEKSNRPKKKCKVDEQTSKKNADPNPHYSLEELLPENPFPRSIDYYKELERFYWKNITFLSPLYGADISGTLFDPSVEHWNVGNLDSLLTKLRKKIPGVNSPYLYFGMWKATFAWHLEDMDLYSINYIHFGAPKQWYSIPPEHHKRFERIVQGLFGSDHRQCPEFIRHKMIMLSPTFLASHSIPVYKCVQEEGEFMITYPYGYHSGYNLGYNCAEAINFALDRWIEIGRKAKQCRCIGDTVGIDVDVLLNPELEREEETTDLDDQKRSRRNKEPKEPTCVLCGKPDTTNDFVPLMNKSAIRAHRICVELIPETSVVNVDGQDMVQGCNDIESARRRLRCKYCDYRQGACIQCAKGQCVTAFHVTCALEQGLCMQRRINEETGDTTSEFYCIRHDPRKNEEKQLKHEEHCQKIGNYIDQYAQQHGPITDDEENAPPVWARWIDGFYYEGCVVRDDRDRSIARILYLDGYYKNVSYDHLELERPFDSSVSASELEQAVTEPEYLAQSSSDSLVETIP